MYTDHSPILEDQSDRSLNDTIGIFMNNQHFNVTTIINLCLKLAIPVTSFGSLLQYSSHPEPRNCKVGWPVSFLASIYPTAFKG